MKRIIAITGYARSGKDTCADLLVKNHNFVKLKFAEKLYQMLAIMLDSNVIDVEKKKENHNILPNTDCSYRYALQTLGTEWGREYIHEDIWAIMLCNKIKVMNLNKVVISDLRFENEASALKKFAKDNNYKLDLIYIHRSGSEPQKHHGSEIEIEDIKEDFCNIDINNNISIHELEKRLLEAIELN